eukprot:SM000001S04714  [mRNA]  locus=s1:1875813:1876920:+ [translate_table: standard]
MASNPDPLPKTYTRRPRVQRSSSLDSSATPEPISKQPFLYRMRGAFSVLLLANLLVGGYLLSKSSPRKRKGEKGKAQNDADKRLIKDVLSGKASWPF